MANTKVSDFGIIGTLDPAADLLPVIDISASGTARNKVITANQLKTNASIAGLAANTFAGKQTISSGGLEVSGNTILNNQLQPNGGIYASNGYEYAGSAAAPVITGGGGQNPLFNNDTDAADKLRIGADSATPHNAKLTGASGVGSNKTGGNFTLQPGNGTGTGPSGSILFQTAPAGSSGSAANTMATAMSINPDGSVTTGRILVSPQLAAVGGCIFDHYADVATSSTNGTEDDLYTDTMVAGLLAANGQKIVESEYLSILGSATAARRVKKYFGGTLIFDSGALTLAAGADGRMLTEIIRESSSVVRVTVTVSTTSASTIPYVTYTRVTGLTLTNTQILKTTGIASGTGALAGDVTNKMASIAWHPAA